MRTDKLADIPVNFSLTPGELVGTIESLHDAILRRLAWSILEHNAEWREMIPFETMSTVFQSLIGSYGKLMFVLTSSDLQANEFVTAFSLPDEMWDIIAELTLAESWDQVSFHEPHDINKCTVCYKLSR